MPRIVSFSLRDEDEYLLGELDKLPGSRSSHIAAALKSYLKTAGGKKAPDWYIPGVDYSHLPLEDRQELVEFGYSDPELETLQS